MNNELKDMKNMSMEELKAAALKATNATRETAISTREAANVTYQKWRELADVREGTKISLTDGTICTFITLKQKFFSAIQNDKSIRVPIEMFVKVLELPKVNRGYENLKKGDLFYISNGKDAILFAFECMEKGKIIGIAPITKGRTKIDSSMYVGTIKELLQK